MGNVQAFVSEFNRITHMRNSSAFFRRINEEVYHYRDLARTFITFTDDERQEAIQRLGGVSNMSSRFWSTLAGLGFDVSPFGRFMNSGRFM